VGKLPATTQQSIRIDYVCHGVGCVELRRFDPSRDSYVALTALLHRAFTRLGALAIKTPDAGSNYCNTVWQVLQRAADPRTGAGVSSYLFDAEVSVASRPSAR
jgi:hypothetical protein